MGGWLLLTGNGNGANASGTNANGASGTGEACRILGIRIAKDPPTLEREGLVVARASVNNDHRGDLALAARDAGDVALGLLFRELNRNDPIARLWIDIEARTLSIAGRSGELSFALATYLKLAAEDLPQGVPDSDFMASGTLDPEGNVGPVEGLALKIRAGLAAPFEKGTRLFYPRAAEAQIDNGLRAACRDGGLLLCAVDRIDEALDALGVLIQGSWPYGVSPFKALDAYDSTFSRVFFGRQREVDVLIALLQARATSGRPGALIIGASGAGKSSFCLAGVLPALARQAPNLEYAVWRPRDALSVLGNEPAPAAEEHLVRSLAAIWTKRDASQTGIAIEPCASDAVRFADLLAGIAPADHRRVLVIDQFEELFALDFAPEARVAFAGFLRALQSLDVWVVGTLRSEFYAHYLELGDEGGKPVLTPVFEGDGQYNLPRMGREALTQVIVRPAGLAGLRFEQRAADGVRLVDALLADAMANEDALPLLGFALQKLYDEAEHPAIGQQRDSTQPRITQPRVLTFAAYERLGGLAGAIGTVAQAAYRHLDRDAQAALPDVLASLAVPSIDGTRETARPAALNQWPIDSPERRLIDALTNIRVLISEQEPASGAPSQLRVAHEALFTHWDEAQRVLDASRQSRVLVEDFRRRAAQWEEEGRSPDLLLTSVRDIANARTMRLPPPVNDEETSVAEFINRSVGRSRRRKQQLFATIGLVAALLIGSSILSIEQARKEGANYDRIVTLSGDIAGLQATRDGLEKRSREAGSALKRAEADKDEVSASLEQIRQDREEQQRELADLQSVNDKLEEQSAAASANLEKTRSLAGIVGSARNAVVYCEEEGHNEKGCNLLLDREP